MAPLVEAAAVDDQLARADALLQAVPRQLAAGIPEAGRAHALDQHFFAAAEQRLPVEGVAALAAQGRSAHEKKKDPAHRPSVCRRAAGGCAVLRTGMTLACICIR